MLAIPTSPDGQRIYSFAEFDAIAHELRERHGFEANAEDFGQAGYRVIIHVPGKPGLWMAGDILDTWGADFTPRRSLDADMVASVDTVCSTYAPTNPEDVAHALAGAIWLWYRFTPR